MLKLIDRARTPARPGASEVGGIMVQMGRPAVERPLTVAFVWGQELPHAPTLPFGRWKASARTAA
jgi:hypothetical protein